jgi:hypothetical protein
VRHRVRRGLASVLANSFDFWDAVEMAQPSRFYYDERLNRTQGRPFESG